VKQLKSFGDERQVGACAHCGSGIRTRDHVPSKVLLDEPYPPNLPVVGSCEGCNISLSADEEYLACLLDCVICGAVDPSRVSRPKVAGLLRERPSLAERISHAKKSFEGRTYFEVEKHRVRRVILKLARGHALFELNERMNEKPSFLNFRPVELMESDERDRFEQVQSPSLWPEVGSRAMQRMLGIGEYGWLEVQEGRYRYQAWADGTVGVRMVLSEYLAAEVVWQDCHEALELTPLD
jgi:hypothetical protein